MFAPPTPEQRELILSLIAHSPEGVSPDGVMKACLPAEDPRKVRQWLEGLVDENLIMMVADGRKISYLAVDPVALLKAYPNIPTAAQSSPAASPSVQSQASPIAPAPTAMENSAPTATEASAEPAPAPASGGRQPSDPDFPKMLDLAIPVLIGVPLDRQGTIVTLRSHAAKNGKTGRGMGAYVSYALARLDGLTPADADAFGITAEEFAAWKSRYAGSATPVPTAAPGAAPARSPAQPAREKTFVEPSIVVPTATSTPVAATTAEPVSQLESALTVASLSLAIRKLASEVVWKSLLPRCKEMIRPKRLMVAWVWGVVLVTFLGSYASYRGYYLVMIPLIGAPWGWFTYREKAKATTLEDLSYAVLLGGVLTFFLANFAVQLLRWGASFGWR